MFIVFRKNPQKILPTKNETLNYGIHRDRAATNNHYISLKPPMYLFSLLNKKLLFSVFLFASVSIDFYW